MSKYKESNVSVAALRQLSEGQLLKYTNMVKGWQTRWFVLDPHSGTLDYFMTESEKKQKPRGSLHLAGAIVVPSEEDSYTFAVNAANDESFKLRAIDARERQSWVNRLRVVAQAYTQVIAESNPPLYRDQSQFSGSSMSSSSAASTSAAYSNPLPSQKMLSCNLTVLDAFSSVRDYLRRVECEHQRLVHDIEGLPSSGPTTTCTDTEMLLLKATSQATLLCLEQCLAILHYQQQQPNKIKPSSTGSSPLMGYNKKPVEVKRAPEPPRQRSESAYSVLGLQSQPTTDPKPSDQAPEIVVATSQISQQYADDESEYIPVPEEPRLTLQEGTNEDSKGKTLNLLSQLKLGTELTRTHLPIFFCETRSFLQVVADAFRQPQPLLKLTKETNDEHRMAKVLQWYLGCIRACQLDMSGPRKPFNPILGETFKCIWHLKDGNGDVIVFRFFGEQVSHDPPVTAFHLECPQLHIFASGNLTIKAKYMGMYVGVSLNGDLVLEVPAGTDEQRTAERYEMAFPMLYLRSFLSDPWMEFGGKINIHSAESKASCSVVFQTKPFYGGKPHQVTAEIKAANGSTAARLSGDWMSGAVELAWTSGSTEIVEVEAEGGWLVKRVRPIARQSENESLKVWDAVRKALVAGEYQTAGELKKALEQQQRERASTTEVYQGVYFERANDVWIRKKT